MQLLLLYTNDLPCYQNIKTWFNNHGRETSGKSKNAKLLDLGSRPKKTRKLQLWQAYSRLYFDDRVKSTFHERLKVYQMEFEAGTISKMPKRLGVLRKVTIEKLEGESDEVKAEVERYRQQHDDEMPDDSLDTLDSSEEASNSEAAKEAKEAKRAAQAKVYLE
jgi:hypothetical protein